MTVTNAQGATLELDEECALSYSPPSTTTTSAAPKDSNNAAAVLRVRSEAPLCTQVKTSTEILTVSRVTTSFSTTTITVTTSVPDFSCPTMAVTDSYGAVLALNEGCSLEYTPGSSTTAPSTTGPQAGAGPVTTGGGEQSIGRPVDGWWMLVARLLGVLVLVG
ncbi:hypothetical protein N7510_010529 [Penicillium lagena]|uniref:uncharacterized protein n=1 Tax=Penicillium lagena TaxID=94218 RepID=UPI0025408370|nr:uncharacterized protein N7510_010529 [Penicillium lagena]KAJ5600995.1 hypothetical protein N7510_010529 [Penicillium lagena]